MLRLADIYRTTGLTVAAVVLTQYAGQQAADVFRHRLQMLGNPCKLHYPIEGYPHDIDLDRPRTDTDATSTWRPRVRWWW